LLLECRLNYAQAEAQLDEFKHGLEIHPEFEEVEVVARLRARLDVCPPPVRRTNREEALGVETRNSDCDTTERRIRLRSLGLRDRLN
jgi:hypothetical protein